MNLALIIPDITAITPYVYTRISDACSVLGDLSPVDVERCLDSPWIHDSYRSPSTHLPPLHKHTAPSCCIRLIRAQAAAMFHAVKSGGYEMFVCMEILSEYLQKGARL